MAEKYTPGEEATSGQSSQNEDKSPTIEPTPERKKEMKDGEASSSKITKKGDEIQSEEPTLGQSSKNTNVHPNKKYTHRRRSVSEETGSRRKLAVSFPRVKSLPEYTELSEGYRFNPNVKLSQNSQVYNGNQKSVVGATRAVAIKLIKDDQENRKEANRHLKLNYHPNVVSMLHSGIYTPDIGSYIYISMEKCRLQNLNEYMKGLIWFQIQLNDDQKLAMAKQFLLGLKFIHFNGIINGNIKLENVLISQDGNYLKICNFGFKRSLHQHSSVADQSRELEDTGANGAPETYTNNVFSKEADVFATGLLVYSIVSDGRHAYGDDPDRRISNIRDNTNRDLSNIHITEKGEMEKLLNYVLEFEPKDRPSVEEALENNIFQKATTDLSLPQNFWELQRESQSSKEEERLEDVFQDDIIPVFPSIGAFRRFARSKRGLCLNEYDLQVIAEDQAGYVEAQKMCILGKWREKMGPEATVPKIRSILEEYQPIPESQPFEKKERLEDVFQDEIIPAFPKIVAFKRFARSRRGLCLDEDDLQVIGEDQADSVEAQKMCILGKWKEKKGPEATVQKIRSTLEEYQKPIPENERLLDTFQDEIIRDFAKMDDFLEFARSKRGLCLNDPDIQHIIEDYSFSVKEQKMQILMKWQELNGARATVQEIQSLLESFRNYSQAAQKTVPEATAEINQFFSEELRCAFKEVTEPYTAIEDLKGFAKSRNGLFLTDNEIQHITSIEGQKMQMLMLWIKRLGSDATVQNLRSCVKIYEAEKDFINLPNGSFGMYKEKILRDQCFVYLGAQKGGSDDQPCAVKLLRHKKNRAEAEMLVKLEQHENVVQVLDVGEYRGGLSVTTFVVMELCSTQHLGDIIKAKEFEEITAESWAKQIVCALVFIHKNNIVHLDIKPQNILFTHDRKYIKLADFDSSKKIQDESGLVQNPSDVGTEGYRAPEMYTDEQITPKVDIFAAGVTLAEVLSHGIHPFGTDRYLRASKVKQSDPDLSHLRISNKDSATKLLMRMLNPKHEDRPTASEVLADALFQK